MRKFMEEIYEELNGLMHEIEDSKYMESTSEQVKLMFRIGADLANINKKIISYLLWGIK